MAYSSDKKVKILINVGAQNGQNGFSNLFVGQDDTGNRFFLQVETSGANRVWMYKTRSWASLHTSTGDTKIDPKVDYSGFLDVAQPDFVSNADGLIPDVNITNDAGGRLKALTNPSGNTPVFSLFGDGITTNPFANGTTDSIYTPPATTTASGIFASISEFITQNPLTSLAIAAGIILGSVWLYNNMEEGGKKKKKRRG